MNETNLVYYNEYNSLIPIFRLTTALLLRAGSLLVQIGTFPTENVFNIIFQNIFDLAVSITSYLTVGTILSFGNKDYKGIIGYGIDLKQENIDGDKIIFGLCAVLVGSSIITQQLSGRLHAVACFVTSFSYSGIFLPIIMHWVWHSNGWMQNLSIRGENKIFKDYAGGIIIHSTAGAVGLVGSLFLGRRLLLLKELDDCSIGIESPNTTFLGYFLYLSGLLGLLLPKDIYTRKKLNMIFINIFYSIGISLITILILQKLFKKQKFNYWSLISCMQATIATLVVISTGIDKYNLILTTGLALIGSMTFFLVSELIHASPLEDYCNVTATHLISGLFGAIFPAVINVHKYKLSKYLNNVLLEISGSLTIICIVIIYYVFICLILSPFKLLRNKTDDKCFRRSIRARKIRKNISFKKKLFKNNDMNLKPGFSAQFKNTSIIIEETKMLTGNKLNSGLRNGRSSETITNLESGDNKNTHKVYSLDNLD